MALLRHPALATSLRALSADEQALLRQWLSRPSHTDVLQLPGCKAVMEQLKTLQQHWAQVMPESMANVAGVLELSIALGNLQPDYSLV